MCRIASYARKNDVIIVIFFFLIITFYFIEIQHNNQIKYITYVFHSIVFNLLAEILMDSVASQQRFNVNVGLWTRIGGQ